MICFFFVADYTTTDYFPNTSETTSRFSQNLQHQQLPQTTQHHSSRISSNGVNSVDNSLYAGNMSKFFDFHKNQQQQQTQQQQFLLNGHSNGIHNAGDHLNMGNGSENNRLGSQFIDHTSNGKLFSKLSLYSILCTFVSRRLTWITPAQTKDRKQI